MALCDEFTSVHRLPAFLPDILSQHWTINFLHPTYEKKKKKKKTSEQLHFLSFLFFTAIICNRCLCSWLSSWHDLTNFHTPNLINKVWQPKGQSVLDEQMFEMFQLFFFASFSYCQLAMCEIRHLEKSRLKIYSAGEARRPAGLEKKKNEEKKEVEEPQGCILGLHLLPWKSLHASRTSLSHCVFMFVEETQLCPLSGLSHKC